MEQNNNPQPSKYFKVSERLWLFLSIASLIWSFTILLTDSFQAAKGYFVLSAVVVLYYFVKLFFRKRVEKQYKEHQKK